MGSKDTTLDFASFYPKDVLEKYRNDEYECVICKNNSLVCGCISISLDLEKEAKRAYKASLRENSNPYQPQKRKQGELVVFEKDGERKFARYQLVEDEGFPHMVAVHLPELEQEIYRCLALRA